MALIVNLRHLVNRDLHLQGELTREELDINSQDEAVQVAGVATYELQAQMMDEAILLQGTLALPLACECVRCLKPIPREVRLTGWSCLVPLEGEEAAPVVNDCVDLTPYLREDILLEFPQHPLCDPECRGLTELWEGKPQTSGGAPSGGSKPSAWDSLSKLGL